MFEALRQYQRILVTGPQRAGTRIATRMIAYDTGHQFVDEYEIYMDSLYVLHYFVNTRENFVVQCPALCRYVHLFGDRADTAIVMMRRNVNDIEASQNRISWVWRDLELLRYGYTEGNIAEIKYDYWDTHQKPLIANPIEVQYDGLATHPLWTPKENRRVFDASQTLPESDKHIINRDVRLRQHPHAVLITPGMIPEDHAALAKLKQNPRAINQTAQMIWTLCDGRRSFGDILDKLRQEFIDVDDDLLAKDLDDILKQLMRGGYIQLLAPDVPGFDVWRRSSDFPGWSGLDAPVSPDGVE